MLEAIPASCRASILSCRSSPGAISPIRTAGFGLLDRLEMESCRVINPASVLRWNSDQILPRGTGERASDHSTLRLDSFDDNGLSTARTALAANWS